MQSQELQFRVNRKVSLLQASAGSGRCRPPDVKYPPPAPPTGTQQSKHNVQILSHIIIRGCATKTFQRAYLKPDFRPHSRPAGSNAWRAGTANHTAEHISVLPRRIVTIATLYRLYLYNGDQKDMCYWCDQSVFEAAVAAVKSQAVIFHTVATEGCSIYISTNITTG